MEILVDEDLPREVAALLTRLGHEALHAKDLGLGGRSDREVFEAAQEKSAILLSADIAFGNIHLYPLGSERCQGFNSQFWSSASRGREIEI